MDRVCVCVCVCVFVHKNYLQHDYIAGKFGSSYGIGTLDEKEQAKSKLWNIHREGRTAASNFKAVV